MKTSNSVLKIMPDLLEAQKEIKHADMKKTNPHFRSKYADLPAVIDAVKDSLNKHNIIILQSSHNKGDQVIVVTRLQHTSGEFVEDAVGIPLEGQSAQKVGSALTYGRRYGLSEICGIASEEDDDGNAASQKNGSSKAPVSNPNQNITPETITINGSDKPCEHCHAPANKPHASSCKVADVH